MQQERSQLVFEQSFWINKLDHTNPRQVETRTEHQLIKHVIDPEDEESYTGIEYREVDYHRYIFEYPPLWRNIFDKNLSVQVRSINSSPFPRFLIFSGLQLWYFPDPRLTDAYRSAHPDEHVELNVDYDFDNGIPAPVHMNISINIALPSREGMTEANLSIANHILQSIQTQPYETLDVWSKNPVHIFYDNQKGEFVFQSLVPKFMFMFDERTLGMSEDWKQFTGTTPKDYYSIGPGKARTTPPEKDDDTIIGSNYDYNNWKNRAGIYNKRIWFSEQELRVKGAATDIFPLKKGFDQLKIKGVWGRERMIVKSDLDPYDEYLGYTNTTFGPPKTFQINHQNKTFWIELYDAITREPIHLPDDGKDTVVMECQFIAS